MLPNLSRLTHGAAPVAAGKNEASASAGDKRARASPTREERAEALVQAARDALQEFWTSKEARELKKFRIRLRNFLIKYRRSDRVSSAIYQQVESLFEQLNNVLPPLTSEEVFYSEPDDTEDDEAEKKGAEEPNPELQPPTAYDLFDDFYKHGPEAQPHNPQHETQDDMQEDTEEDITPFNSFQDVILLSVQPPFVWDDTINSDSEMRPAFELPDGATPHGWLQQVREYQAQSTEIDFSGTINEIVAKLVTVKYDGRPVLNLDTFYRALEVLQQIVFETPSTADDGGLSYQQNLEIAMQREINVYSDNVDFGSVAGRISEEIKYKNPAAASSEARQLPTLAQLMFVFNALSINAVLSNSYVAYPMEDFLRKVEAVRESYELWQLWHELKAILKALKDATQQRHRAVYDYLEKLVEAVDPRSQLPNFDNQEAQYGYDF